jgi:hypothetical protein
MSATLRASKKKFGAKEPAANTTCCVLLAHFKKRLNYLFYKNGQQYNLNFAVENLQLCISLATYAIDQPRLAVHDGVK